jgi:hypothetical protein
MHSCILSELAFVEFSVTMGFGFHVVRENVAVQLRSNDPNIKQSVRLKSDDLDIKQSYSLIKSFLYFDRHILIGRSNLP